MIETLLVIGGVFVVYGIVAWRNKPEPKPEQWAGNFSTMVMGARDDVPPESWRRDYERNRREVIKRIYESYKLEERLFRYPTEEE